MQPGSVLHGPKYNVDQARAESPRFRTAFRSFDDSLNTSNCSCFYIPGPSDNIWTSWHESNRQSPNHVFAWHTNRYQRKLTDPEAIAQHEAEQARLAAEAAEAARRKATETALAEPTVKYALMPKLEEIQGLLADETHGKILGIDHATQAIKDEDIPAIKKTLGQISRKAGNADNRLENVETAILATDDKLQALDEKTDKLKTDIYELKGMLVEILAAVKISGSPSRN